MVWDASQQTVLLIGGQTSAAGYLNDVWKWDGTTWSAVTTTGTAPSARSGAVVVYQPGRAGTILFGGLNASGSFNDTWMLKNNAWSLIQANGASTTPSARWGATGMLDSYNNVVLFGGMAVNSGPQGDTYTLSTNGTTWGSSSPAHTPPARFGASGIFDPALGVGVVFGGVSYSGSTPTYLNDTWAWTGGDWLLASGIASPTGRAFATTSTDARGQVSMFGGQNSSILSETWIYDASAPLLTLSVSGASDGTTASPVYYTGDTVQFDLTLTNPGWSAVPLSAGSTLASWVTAGLSMGGSTLQFNGVVLAPCTSAIVAPCGSISNLNALIAGITLPAGGSATARFYAVAAGAQQGCTILKPRVSVGNRFGASVSAGADVPICGDGLGLEDSWTFDTTDLGNGSAARVNVANGNVVLQASDSTPVQSRGGLEIGLTRTYNSQEQMTATGPLGAGWQFDIGETGSEAVTGIGFGGLKLPTLQGLTQPMAVAYVDRDGTRHVFTLRSLQENGEIGLDIDLGAATGSAVRTLLDESTLPFAIHPSGDDPPYADLCIDQTYTGPAGTGMNLFRYVGVGSDNACANPAASSGIVVGWSLVRTDRLRYDFNATGQLIRITDPSGQSLDYTPGTVYGPTKIAPSTCASTSTCPSLTINYDAGGAGANRRVTVTDTAGRVTSYVVTRDPTPTLIEVWQPGNPYSTVTGAVPSSRYAYSTLSAPCSGSVSGTSSVAQICSVTDASGGKTTFDYEPASLGPDRVHTVTDRRGNVSGDGSTTGLATRYTWQAAAGSVAASATADKATPAQIASCDGTAACRRTRYSGIDTRGRVAVIEEGTANNVYLHQTGYFWNTAATAAFGGVDCTVGAAMQNVTDLNVQNWLCQVIDRAEPSSTAFVLGQAGTTTGGGVTVSDHAVDYSYSPLGQLVRTRVLRDASQPWTDANSDITTYGSHEQYFESDGQVRTYDYTPHGHGAVAIEQHDGGAAYRQTVLDDSPIAYWRLDETDNTPGVEMRSETGTNNGVVTHPLALGEPGIMPGHGAALESASPDGTGMVSTGSDLPSGASGSDGEFSIETWQRSDSLWPETSLTWGDLAGSSRAVIASRDLFSFPNIGFYTNAAEGEFMSTDGYALVLDGRWHHVVYTYDGSFTSAGLSIWVDGQKVPQLGPRDTTSAVAPYASSTDPVYLGGNSQLGVDNGGSWLDEVSVYDRVLSKSQIEKHYSDGSPLGTLLPGTMFAVADQTAQLSPRGNAAAVWGDYLTTYRRDLPAVGTIASINHAAGSTICGSATRGNTGVLCEVDTPASNGVPAGDCASPVSGRPAGASTPPTSATYAFTCTTYRYNGAGQRIETRTPGAHARGSDKALSYAYYDDVSTCSGDARVNCDLSGTVSAGGWLKSVTDQAGEKVIYAYDAAGNVVRTWDRNATHGLPADTWSDPSAPPSDAYSESVYGSPVTPNSFTVSAHGIAAILSDGSVAAAGDNSNGSVGIGSTTAKPSATAVPIMHDVVQVASTTGGASTSCPATYYLTGGGDVWVTGLDAGTSTSYPTKLAGLANIASIAVGACHLVALDDHGRVYVHGLNDVGQLGNGSTTATTAVTQPLSGVVAISAGATHSLALKADGTVYAWGSGADSQLGLGNTTSQSSPTLIPNLTDIRAIDAGVGTSFAIRRDGTVYAWGRNTQGDLGLGDTATHATPTVSSTLGKGSSAGTVKQMVATNGGGAALMSSGTVRAWGLNDSGQLAGASGTYQATPIEIAGLGRPLAVAGGGKTFLAADAAGQIRVWGATGSYQRADGTNPATTTTPTVAGISISPYQRPGGFVRSTRDAAGDTSATTYDLLSNPRTQRPARGFATWTSAYDSVASFDAADRITWSLSAANHATAAGVTTTYDPFGNAVKVINERGYATVSTFDAVDRLRSVQTTRGSPNSLYSTCNFVATTAVYTAAQNGHAICMTVTIYDGLDHPIVGVDATGQVTRRTFDAAGNQVKIEMPRNDSTYTTVTSTALYDADGHLTVSCSPRQMDTAHEASATGDCAAGSAFATTTTWDRAGRQSAVATHRGSVALTKTATFDADGNTTATTDANGHTATATFDLQGRQLSQTVPRSASSSYTTDMTYDYVGNLIASQTPGVLATGNGSAGDLVVDGTTAASSTDGVAHGTANPFLIPVGAQYQDVTLQNGAVATTASGNGLLFYATGTVTIKPGSNLTMTGAGGTGGLAGTGALGGNGGDAQNANPGFGGKGGAGGLLGLTPAAGGGGGGHKTSGTNGQGLSAGSSGKESGTADFTDVGTGSDADYLSGSGGGGGGGGKSLLGSAGKGGDGGGFIHVIADTITTGTSGAAGGTIVANGKDGGAGSNGSGGGGGGAGGGVWLTANTVALATSADITVAGGAGGAGGGLFGGGAGAPGYIRVESSDATNLPDGVDRTQVAAVNTNAYAYDAANRLTDQLLGAQTLQANPQLDHSAAAAPDAYGYANTRTHYLYDVDNQIVAVLSPNAYSTQASLTNPDVDYATRIDRDLNGRVSASYSPRYDTARTALDDLASSGSSDGALGANQQKAQCSVGGAAVVDYIPGLASYPTSLGVCAIRQTYDAASNLARQVLPNSANNGTDGRYLDYTYTDDNLLQTVTGPDPRATTATSTARITTATVVEDGNGRTVSVTDGRNNTTQTTYTGDGLVSQVAQAAYGSLTHVTKTTWDADGNQKTRTDPNGAITTWNYTSDGLVSSIAAPGKDASTTNTTQYDYDAAGNPTSVRQPQQVAAGDPATVNTYTYDNLLASTFAPANANFARVNRYTYDPTGAKASSTAGTCGSADIASCTGSAWHSAGTQRFTYAANGRAIDQIGRKSLAITTRYDQAGNPTQIIDPTSGGTTIAASYYLDGQLRTATDGNTDNGYAWDGSGNPTVRTVRTTSSGPTGGSTKVTSYGYNGAGLAIATQTDVLSSGTGIGSGHTVNTYNAVGEPSTSVSGSHQTAWTWNADDTLNGVAQTYGGTLQLSTLYTYDNNKQVKRQTVTTGSGVPVATYVDDYTYAPSGNLTSWSHDPDGSSGAGATATTYAWDRNSNKASSSVTPPGGTASTTNWTYQWDNTLKTVDAPGTNFDATYTYNDGGQLTSDGCSSYTYDGFDRTKKVTNSNSTICGTSSNDPHTTTFTYDGLDRQQTSSVTGSSTSAENSTLTNSYDGLSSTVAGQQNAVNGKHSHPEVLYALDATGTPYGYAQTAADPMIALLDINGLGDTGAITSDSGTAICSVSYDPFGNPIGAATTSNASDMCASGSPATQSSATANAVWYRGQTRSAATGDYQLGARTYDPATGTFTTPDAFRLAAPGADLAIGTDPVTANTYTYVNGNPINAVDPSGHRAIDASGNELSPCVSNPRSCTSKAAAKEQKAYDRLLKSQAKARMYAAARARAKHASDLAFYKKNGYFPDQVRVCVNQRCGIVSGMGESPYIDPLYDKQVRAFFQAVVVIPVAAIATAGCLAAAEACAGAALESIPGAEGAAGLGLGGGAGAAVLADKVVGGAESAANGVSRLVPGGGLAAHEAAGGHALARHLGMTDADLLARLSAQPGITGASSFSSRAVAESSVAGLLDANASGISSWLAGSGGKLVLNGSVGITGRYVAQGSTAVSNVSGVRAVLVRDANMSIGYRIQTAFPTP
ncbi:MAG: RHS repeat-associated core domain-containing protein [Nocardioides sp.]|uniref:RCC1 domain-containing protein n=1 Tax=Nocardioides sp. TaxID=35761 RepID=UPI0039E5113E